MRIVIPGNPIAKARHRCMCRGHHAVAYDPQAKIAIEMSDILIDIVNAWPENEKKAIWGAYLDVRLSFHVQAAESSTDAKKRAKFWKFEYPSQKDLSNLIKFYEDLGNGIIWHDDSQIVHIDAFMQYSENPCTIIDIKAINIPMQHIVFSHFSPSEFEAFIEKLKTIDYFYKATALKYDTVDLDRRGADQLCEKVTEFATLYADKLKKIAKAK